MTSAHKWFPDLPDRWEVARLGACFEQVRETVKHELGIVTVFRDGEVTLRSHRRSDGYTEATDYSLYQVIEPGHLAIHNMDAFAGAIGVSDSHGMCSPVVTVCKPKPNVNVKYFSLVLREMARSGWIEANAKSVRERTSEFRWPMAKSQLVPLPPRAEQDAIVDFLDIEIESIHLLLDKLLELKKLLSARFESALNKEFSKMVGSGIPIRYLAKHLDIRDSKSDLPLMSVSKIHGVISRSEITDKAARAESIDHYKICKPGDLVINRMSANTGALGVSRQAGRVSPDYMVLEFVHMPDSLLVENLFKSPKMRSEMSSRVRGIGTIESVGVRTPRLTWSNLADIRIDFPSSEAQAVLSQKMSDQKRQSDQLLEKTEQVIQALRSRKASLINSVVMGKIDVLGVMNG